MTTAYDELQEAWKREFRNGELQPLRQGIFKDLAAYTKRLREAQRNLDEKSLKAKLLSEELRRIGELFNQLLDHRVRKMESQTNLDQATMLESVERDAYHAISDIQRDYQNFAEGVIHGRERTTTPGSDPKTILLRFVKDVPSIIGVDLKTHGPFQREDIASLPRENAESLVRQGTAVEVRTAVQDNG